jgi:hypothetical protein
MTMLARTPRVGRTLGWWSRVLLLALVTPGSSAATVVRIENTAALDDHSDRAIGRAIEQAVERSTRGATTLGLASVQLEDAVVLSDRVLVRVVARDAAAEQAQDDRADEEVAVVDIGSETSDPR